MRLLAKFASVELYQLTLISICLVSGWITGHLVRPYSNAHPVSLFETSSAEALLLTLPQPSDERGLMESPVKAVVTGILGCVHV